MGRSIISILAILLVSLIAVNAVGTPVVHAVAPAVVIGVAAIAGGLLGAILGYWLGKSAADARGAYEQYQHDVNIYTWEAMFIYEDAYDKMLLQMKEVHDQLINKTNMYYMRWGESIASSVCNQNKNSITDDDLKPIIEDLSTIIENYVNRVLDALEDLYKKGVSLARMRNSAGVGDEIQYLYVEGGQAFVTSSGLLRVKLGWGEWEGSGEIRLHPIGWLRLKGSVVERYIDKESIVKILKGEIPASVEAGLVVANEQQSVKITGFVLRNGVGINPASLLSDMIRDIVLLYTVTKINADNYCQMIAGFGGAPIPPPSVALPFDMDTLSRLDPRQQMIFYSAYLNALAQTEWSKVSNLTASNVTVPSNVTRIEGCVDLNFDGEPDACGGFLPFTMPFMLFFQKNGTWGLAGYVYYIKPDGSIEVIQVPAILFDEIQQKASEVNATPIETPEDYPHDLYNVTWYDPEENRYKEGIGVDVDKDGKIDYVTPSINVSSITTVTYNPDTGQYEEKEEDSLTTGPKPADEWGKIMLELVKALEEKNKSSFSLEGLKNWWNSLDLKKKALIVGGVLVVLVVLVMAAGGSRVVVVGRR